MPCIVEKSLTKLLCWVNRLVLVGSTTKPLDVIIYRKKNFAVQCNHSKVENPIFRDYLKCFD